MTRAQKRVLRRVAEGKFAYDESWSKTVGALLRRHLIVKRADGSYCLGYRGREVYERVRRK